MELSLARITMSGRILTGTASWSDPGFIEAWYPAKLPATQRLRWYAEHFSLVEINSTFYRIPEARLAQSWCHQTPEGFVFDVKLHRYLSRHSTKIDFLPKDVRTKAEVQRGRVRLTPKLENAVAKQFLAGIKPLAQEGKLGALLLQLSPEFGPRDHQLNELDSLLEVLAGYRVAIELRNRGWVLEERLAETRRFFKRRHLTFVMVDGPDDPHFMILPSIDLITTPALGYIRAHGRNAAGYIRKRTVAGRFNYDYSKTGLEQLAERAARMARDTSEMHVVYNNNKADYAPRAAATFQEILIEKHPALLPGTVKEKVESYA
jgi:uncharacterized protein YecE (DUF72 family)